MKPSIKIPPSAYLGQTPPGGRTALVNSLAASRQPLLELGQTSHIYPISQGVILRITNPESLDAAAVFPRTEPPSGLAGPDPGRERRKVLRRRRAQSREYLQVDVSGAGCGQGDGRGEGLAPRSVRIDKQITVN